MSVVDPRPEWSALKGLYETGQRKLLCATLGPTGWWQIGDRGDGDKSPQVQYDLYYLQNYPLWLDLKILWKTGGCSDQGREC